MKHHLTVKGALDADEVRTWLARPLQRLRTRLVHFPPDAVHLRTLVRGLDARPLTEAAITLQLPSATLAVSEEGSSARAALAEAFGELERLLDKEKSRLRRAHSWRRSRDSFQQELMERVASQVPLPLTGPESRELRAHIQEAERFARRELRWLVLGGELVEGEIDPRDVVDAAFERAFAREDRHPSRQGLLRAAAAELRAEVARAREARQDVHIEEAAPGDEVSPSDGELYDFYQPDDELRMEDLLGAVAGAPEEIEAGAEVVKVLREALAALPARWRQAFQLHRVDQLDEDAIGELLEAGPEEVPYLLTHTQAFLRARLLEAGLLPRE